MYMYTWLYINFILDNLFIGNTFSSTDPTVDDVSLSINDTTPPTVGSSSDVTFTCTVRLTCNGTCSATNLSVTWFNNGTEVNSRSQYSITRGTQEVNGTSDVTSTLSINGAVNISHAGPYICRAQSMDSTPPVNLSVQRKWHTHTHTHRVCIMLQCMI